MWLSRTDRNSATRSRPASERHPIYSPLLRKPSCGWALIPTGPCPVVRPKRQQKPFRDSSLLWLHVHPRCRRNPCSLQLLHPLCGFRISPAGSRSSRFAELAHACKPAQHPRCRQESLVLSYLLVGHRKIMFAPGIQTGGIISNRAVRFYKNEGATLLFYEVESVLGTILPGCSLIGRWRVPAAFFAGRPKPEAPSCPGRPRMRYNSCFPNIRFSSNHPQEESP